MKNLVKRLFRAALARPAHRPSPPQRRTRLACETLEARDVPATWSFYGPGVGDAALASNWLMQMAPTEGEDIHVGAGTGSMNLGLSHVGLIDVQEGYAGTITTTGALSVDGGSVEGGTLSLGGNFTNMGHLVLDGVTFTTAAAAAAQPAVWNSGELEVKGSRTITSDVSITNAGTVWFGTAPGGGATAFFRLEGDGPKTLTNTGTVHVTGQTWFDAASIINTGTWYGQAQTFVAGVGAGGGNFVNNGGALVVLRDMNIVGTLRSNGGSITLPTQGIGLNTKIKASGHNFVTAVDNSIYTTNTTWGLGDESRVEGTYGWMSVHDTISFTGDRGQYINDNFTVVNSTITLGEASTNPYLTGTAQGRNTVTVGGKINFDGVTLEAHLNALTTSLDKIVADGSVTVTGGVYALAQTGGGPGLNPAVGAWTAVQSHDSLLVGGFGTYMTGADFGVRLKASVAEGPNNTLEVFKVGFVAPPAPVPPAPAPFVFPPMGVPQIAGAPAGSVIPGAAGAPSWLLAPGQTGATLAAAFAPFDMNAGQTDWMTGLPLPPMWVTPTPMVTTLTPAMPPMGVSDLAMWYATSLSAWASVSGPMNPAVVSLAGPGVWYDVYVPAGTDTMALGTWLASLAPPEYFMSGP